METARNNVTDISRFARGPLEDSRMLAVSRLDEALGESFRQVVGQLLGMVEKAAGLDKYHLYMDAMELARDRAEPIRAAFREAFLRLSDIKCRRDAGGPAAGGELCLLEPDDLEASLAAGNLANAVFNACSEELFGLDQRIGLLIDDPGLGRGDNPLGPETLGKAVVEALDGQESPLRARLLLVSLLGRDLPERARGVYQEINRRLVEHKVLPTIRVGLKRQGQADPVVRARTGADGLGGSPVPEGGGDLFGMLRRLLTDGMARGAGRMFIPGPALPGEAANSEVSASGHPALRPGTFFHALNQLQHGRPGEAAGHVAEAVPDADGRVNVLRGLREGRLAGMMNPLDDMTLDIVAMMFDYILGDDRIPDAIKALVGRLQIPMLKVAMLDKGFFSQKTHPARGLLDTLADAAIGWDESEGHESGLYRKIEHLIGKLLERFDDNLEVFSEALAELQAYLDEEGRVAERATERSARVVERREQFETGLRAARDSVAACLGDGQVPGVIRDFLGEHWARLLADVHAKAGPGSETWHGALATMEELVWSVAPKVDAEERRRLVALLPRLLKRLDEGARCLRLDAPVRDAFFSSLVKCHAEAVKAGVLEQDADGPAFVEAVAEAGPPDGFEPVAEMVEVAEGEEAFAGEAEVEAGNDAGPEEGPDLLERGSWIVYRQEDGVEVRARLSWISPLKGLYLFTNRQGQRAMSISAEGLAARLASGEVRVLDTAPLVDRAVGSLLEQLGRNAA